MCYDSAYDYRGSCGTACPVWWSPGINISMTTADTSDVSLKAAGSANAAGSHATAGSRNGGGAGSATTTAALRDTSSECF